MCLIVVSSCSGSTSGPGGGDETPESFSVSYTAEIGLAVSGVVSASSGGSIEATGSNGVVYRLSVPAGALQSDTTVTITPLSSLDVSGPGTFICSVDCPETDCCVTGALFEPDGLEFDSLVTLEVEFPMAGTFPFDSTAAVYMFDSEDDLWAACESETDYDSRTLTAHIWHFSGYGTGASDCERLMAMYEIYRVTANALAGQRGFFYELYLLVHIKSANLKCDPSGWGECAEMCTGLNELVSNAAIQALTAHQATLLSIYPASPATIEGVEHLAEELSQVASFSNIEELSTYVQIFEGAMLQRIYDMAQDLASQGQQLCSSGDCDGGRALLSYVESMGERGLVTNEAFLTNVSNWLEDCCSFWRLTITTDRTEILRAVVNDGDEDMCVATLTLKLTTSSGQPVQGVFLDCDLDPSGVNLPGGESDENGEWKVIVTARSLGYGEKFLCEGLLYREVISSVYNSETSEWTYADPVMLTFKNFLMTTTVNYTYTAEEYEDAENHGTESCTISGGGSSYANVNGTCSTSCSGNITRSFSSSGVLNGASSANTLVGGIEVPGCLLRARIETYDRGDGVLLYAFTGMDFYHINITDDVQIQLCSDGECDDFWTNLSSWVEWPGYGGIPDFLENVTGTFEPINWTFSETSEIGSKDATLNITLEVGY